MRAELFLATRSASAHATDTLGAFGFVPHDGFGQLEARAPSFGNDLPRRQLTARSRAEARVPGSMAGAAALREGHRSQSPPFSGSNLSPPW